jgi:hypothetical protein
MPVRAALAGEASDNLVLDAINRRGRPVSLRLRFAPLSSDGSGVRGAIVMMEVGDTAGSDGA